MILLSIWQISSQFWIGITDSREEGKWVYSSDGSDVHGNNSFGESILDFNRMAYSEGDKDNQDCAYWWEAYSGGWWDTKCTSGYGEEFNYVCEKGICIKKY